MNRTKNASRNVFWGLVNMIFSRIMPFVVRTIIIRVLGIQYAGLGSLFTSLLSMLSLAELGIGSALTYGMIRLNIMFTRPQNTFLDAFFVLFI